jgi:hypothetical protein
MTPDIEQPLELLAGILAVTLAILHRLLKRRNGRLRLTLSVTEENSDDLPPNTRPNRANGRKTDSNDVEQQHVKRPRGD